MNFEYPAVAEAFRAELRAFMKEEIPSWWTNILADDDRSYGFSREFCMKLGAKGWLTMAWPKEYGGAEADVWFQNVLREEMWAMGEPRGQQYQSLNFIGYAFMMFGTDEQKERYLKPISTGEVCWCQAFTEPHCGSDLAALKMTAEDTGKGFKLNGHKTWVSYARNADHCILLVRTDPESAKHGGISLMMVDMDTPGIVIRDTPTMAGQTKVQELIFEDAEVPYEALIGPRDQGWSVAMQVLERERVGLGYAGRIQIQLDQLSEYIKTANDSNGRPLRKRGDIRTKIMRLKALNRGLRLVMDKVTINPSLADAAAFKVLAGDITIAVGELALEVTGQRGLLKDDDPFGILPLGGPYMWWVYALPVQVAAGPSAIQRNIIAQRELGLPRGK